MALERIAVLGLGKVGHLAAELLQASGFAVTAMDVRAVTAAALPVTTIDVADGAVLASALRGHDAVLSCLPYALNRGVADVAQALGIHYFDLTEDVPTTRHIRELARPHWGAISPLAVLASSRMCRVVGTSSVRSK